MTAPPYKAADDRSRQDLGRPADLGEDQAGRGALTGFYGLRSLDLERTVDGDITPVAKSQALPVAVLWRTFYISALVTLITLVLAYQSHSCGPCAATPVEYPAIFILVPFWTSLLVRTQHGSCCCRTMVPSGTLSLPECRRCLRSSGSSAVSARSRQCAHQLPFTLLADLGVMKGISPAYMRAARSLGGGPFYSFVRVYLPLHTAGIGAVACSHFILSLGYYITRPSSAARRSDGERRHRFGHEQENNWGKAMCAERNPLLATMCCSSFTTASSASTR